MPADRSDEVRRWLEKACQEHDGWMWALKVDPWYDPLRHEPRFQKLVKMVENGGRDP